MPEHHHPRLGKLLPRHPDAIMRISQDMHNSNPTLPHHNLALNRQFHYDLLIFNIALYSYHRRYHLQLINNRKDREIARVNNQFDAR